MRSSIHNVRETVAALRVALLQPSIEGIELQLPALQDAALTLERLKTDPLRSESEFRQQLEALARDLRGSRRLAARGLEMTQGIARLLTPVTAGYRPDGEPIPAKLAGTILIRG
jgi:hypothetical protein